MSRKARIIERTGPTGHKQWVIQQRHFILRWMWVDAWVNSWMGAACQDSFYSLADATAHLPCFDGTPTIEEVVSDQ